MAAPPETLDVRTMKDWTIVVAEDAIPSERYAAEEFRTFLCQATGHELPIAAAATVGGNVFIGPSPALRASDLAHLMDAAYVEEELRVVVATNIIAIMGGRPRGVLYGVYQFLEDALGVRFLAKNFTHVPRYQADDPLPRRGVLTPMDYAYRPLVSCRFVAFPDLQDTTAQFQARLRVNGRYREDPSVEPEWSKRVGGFNRNGLVLHNINSWLRASPQEHPEYYAADKDGKRPVSHQPCFSNPDVVDRITANVLKDLRDFAPGAMIPMAQEDASLCECERCQALVREHGLDPFGGGGENWGAPLFLAINHVAREVAKAQLENGSELYCERIGMRHFSIQSRYRKGAMDFRIPYGHGS